MGELFFCKISALIAIRAAMIFQTEERIFQNRHDMISLGGERLFLVNMFRVLY